MTVQEVFTVDGIKKIQLPTGATLRKYGLSVGEWMDIFVLQEGKCAICHRDFTGIRANIDHEHVRGWKKMAPAQRRGYVRGLLCYQCNKFMVMRGVTSEKLYQGWQYLRNFEVRITPQALAAQSGGRNLDAAKDVVQRRNIRHTDQKQHKKHNTG